MVGPAPDLVSNGLFSRLGANVPATGHSHTETIYKCHKVEHWQCIKLAGYTASVHGYTASVHGYTAPVHGYTASVHG